MLPFILIYCWSKVSTYILSPQTTFRPPWRKKLLIKDFHIKEEQRREICIKVAILEFYSSYFPIRQIVEQTFISKLKIKHHYDKYYNIQIQVLALRWNMTKSDRDQYIVENRPESNIADWWLAVTKCFHFISLPLPPPSLKIRRHFLLSLNTKVAIMSVNQSSDRYSQPKHSSPTRQQPWGLVGGPPGPELGITMRKF